jgi:hypothetical protein
LSGIGAKRGQIKLPTVDGAWQAHSSNAYVASTTLLRRKLLLRFRAKSSFHVSGDGGAVRDAFAFPAASEPNEQNTARRRGKQNVSS